MSTFRKKSGVVEAEQFNGEIPTILYDENREVHDISLGVEHGSETYSYLRMGPSGLTALPGDWIVIDEHGGRYLYTPDAFAQAFEPVGG